MRKLRQALSLLALARSVQGDALPYNPTRIFLQPNSSLAYIFGPSSKSNGQAQLSSLDISDAFTTTNHELSTITDTLPFLRKDALSPYAPTIDAGGNIHVIAGKCSEKPSVTQVWQFRPDVDIDSLSGSGTWKQYSTSYKQGGDVAGYAGLGYLSNSIAFSDSADNNGKDTSVYVFGGMCPYDNSTTETWISRAEYSNSMLTVSPDASNYDISMVASRGPPVSQAGSSITALPPTYGMDVSGTARAQQQDFVLLGGNTNAAFINMSQVALFSLPQQSWSFIEVLQPTNDKTDLAIRQTATGVTPRSGHTAVLSESGDKIILFGGWVGDVNTPANPQLAVLELGAGYGGSGDWKWTIPSQSGTGPEVGTGIYGHGATMLPGGVMMIMGGYEIPGSSSNKMKRASQAGNSRMFLYNTTSHTWLRSYAGTENIPGSKESSGPLSSTSAKVGLGTGLGIGAALLISIVGFYLWYGKRLKSAQEDRERALLSYSSDGSVMAQLDQPFLAGGMDGRVGDGPAVARSWPTGGQIDGSYPRPPPTQHATGAWVNVPSPTRGLRKGSAGKYQFHAATRYDDKRISRGSGNIHPIAEHENEDEQEYMAGSVTRDGLSNAEMRLREVERVLHPEDPFTDNEPNPLGSHPISSIAGDTVRRVPTNVSVISPYWRPQASNEKYAANWTVEASTKDMVFEEQEHGFSLVNGDDRTSSTLSERSQHSTTSTSSITRTMSTRTGAVLTAALASHHTSSSPRRSPTHERSNTVSTNASSKSHSHSRSRALSFTHGSITGGDEDSFMSARSDLAQLPNEGEALFSCRPAMDPDDPYQRAVAAQSPTRGKTPYYMYNSGPPPPIPPRRRPGLMGSLRRALNVVSLSDRSVSLGATGDHYEDGIRTSSSSPTKDRTSTAAKGPRRAVSDGGALLLRQKRGEKDWDINEWPPYRDDPDAGDWGEPTEPKSSAELRQAEEDWDVESAAVNRDFQVMFTIPKSKLRVVNDDMDRASLRSASDGGVSRSGSVRRDGSVKHLKVRTDGENTRLPSTEEENDDLFKTKAA